MESRNKPLPIGAAAERLGVSVMTLRRWDASGKLPALKGKGGHRYYYLETLERFQRDLYALARLWAASEMAPEISSENYSDFRDSFIARLETMAVVMDKQASAAGLAPLVTAMAGEIGNNSFDHNLGNWPDMPGIFFGYDLHKRVVVLADRGVGVRTTLSRVRPDLKDDLEALTVAMTEPISGRSPEQRGNGLKFVAKLATSNRLGMALQSGAAVATVAKDGDKHMKIGLADRFVRGVLARVEF